MQKIAAFGQQQDTDFRTRLDVSGRLSVRTLVVAHRARLWRRMRRPYVAGFGVTATDDGIAEVPLDVDST
jgi:hypothetical protein